MKDRSSPASPVAVSHSDKSCCKCRRCVLLEMGAGSSLSAPVTLGLGEPVSWPCAPARWAFERWWGAPEGEPQRTENPWVSVGVEGHTSFVSLSPWGTERNRGEVMMVLCFGRTLLPKWKLHFWLCPLLSLWWKAVHSVSGPSRSGLAGLGWVLLGPVSGKPCHPGLLSEAGFGRWLPSLSRGSAPRAPILESSLTSSGVLVQAAVLGSHPFPLQLPGSHAGGCRGTVRPHVGVHPACITAAVLGKSGGRTWLQKFL